MNPLDAMRARFVELPIPTVMPKGRALYPGVYLLVDRGVIVYVGSSSEVEMRVWTHRSAHFRRGGGPPGKRFDQAFWLARPAAVMAHYEGAFIRRLAPKHNHRAPRYCGHDNEILEGFGLEPHPNPEAVAARWRRKVVSPPQRNGVLS